MPSETDKGTDNLQAYDEFLKGWQGYRLLTNAGFAEAKIHLEKAVELDPEFARANAALAVLYWKAVQTAAPGLRQGLGVTNHAALDAVRTKPLLLLKKAMRKPTALAHGLMSQVYLYRYLHDEALSEIERAVAMDPNDPELYAWMSTILWFMGKNREAIESAKMGQRLDPNNPAPYLILLGNAYLPDGNLQESLTDNYRISRENLINGQEVKSLLFGRKITGISMITGEQYLWEFAKSGEWKFISGAFQNTGKSWVEENVFFSQSEKLFGGLPYGNTIFRNPGGSRESKNEYYMVNDLRGINPFAPTE